MMKRVLSAFFTTVLCISGNLSAEIYGGGSGTAATPYEIWTPAQMNLIGANSADWGKHFKLMAHIDMSAYTGTQYNIIGSSFAPFTGTFDGDSKVISNLTLTPSTQNYVGLFGYVGIGGQIRNLGIEYATITATGRTYVGGLVGQNQGGSLSNCYAIGSVTGYMYVGGLVGYNSSGTITSCYATGSVSGTGSYVGGLAGYNQGTLTTCYANGSVSSRDYVGGLVGMNSGTINSCYATGSVAGTDQFSKVGGLVGTNLAAPNNPGTLIACHATGSVTGKWYVGGLVGMNQYGFLTSCYATGSVTGTGYYVGGLVGTNDQGTLTSCYATGSVTGAVSGSNYVGGLVGSNSSVYGSFGTLTGCYATGSVSGATSVGGLVGYNQGPLTTCYATGSVTGGYYIGGLAGYNEGILTGCYATGSATGIVSYVGGLVGANSGSLTACFWDVQTSGKTVGVGSGTATGVTGKTTAEMMTLSTFMSPPTSWDFSTTDGDPADWMMLREGEDYPRLAWQPVIAGDIAGLYGVTFVDYAQIAAHWGQTGCPTGCENADINNDGTVDITDLMSLADNWQAGL
jgi:hypothetical protein